MLTARRVLQRRQFFFQAKKNAPPAWALPGAHSERTESGALQGTLAQSATTLSRSSLTCVGRSADVPVLEGVVLEAGWVG
ncbi:hypothetical protein GCM10027569_36360 [Flindersiella endophytica]